MKPIGASQSDRLRGRVVRTLELAPRTATETFWLDGPRKRWEPKSWWSDADVIGEQAIEGPVTGPLLLWDEHLGRAEDLAALRDNYFAGNLAAWTPRPGWLERDATALAPVSDAEFWHVIDGLGGRTWERTINSAARALAASDEDFILRWEETMALKALGLHDALTRAHGSYGDVHTIMAVLGATIGRGRETYEAVTAEPALFDPKWLNDNASSVLFLGSFALDRKLRESVQITTSFTELHLRLLAQWEAEMNARRTGKPVETHHIFVAARALVGVHGAIRLRMIFAEIDGPDAGQLHALGRAIEAFGGSVCSPVERDEMQFGSLMNGPVFTVKRRFTGTRGAYLERFVTAQL